MFVRYLGRFPSSFRSTTTPSMNKRSTSSASRRAFCVSLACVAFAALTNFSGAAPVPASLDAVGESAEGIFDGVRANKWSKVGSSIKEIGAKLQEFPAAKVASADFTAALAALEKAAKTKDRLE